MMDSSDADLIAAIVGGDVDAFAILVQRYRDRSYRLAVRLLGTREDAEDALQDAFVRAYRNLDQCRDRDRFRSWLSQIVVNECRTRATRGARRDRDLVRDAHDAIADPYPVSDTALSGEIEYALAQLVPEQREAFILKYVEELGYDEMAELTGASVSALKMRVKRGCERLRELLEGVVT